VAIDRKRPAAHLAALALVASLALPHAALAQSGGASLHAGTLEVPLNKSQVVSADRPIAKAMVGNDEIADILPITDRSIYVLGKKMGTTSLTMYDSGGRVISVVDIAVGPDVLALGDQLRLLVPGDNLEARITNESVVLTGTVNSAGAASRAAQLAKAYAGEKVINLISMGSSQQVMLEVRFAEVNRIVGKDISVNHAFGSDDGRTIGGTGKIGPDVALAIVNAITGGGSTSVDTGGIANQFGVIGRVHRIFGMTVGSALDALERNGFAKTLAQPTLIALSGEKASFLAGGEFPVPVAQSGGGGTGTQALTVEFKAFGVSLGFTPTVLGDRTINIIVEPEVSAIDPAASITVGNISIPGLRTRRAHTTVELRDGESFAIAGLLQRDFQTTVNQVPLLGSIPIIGALFRSSSFQKGETELLIVVTPRLVAPITPGQVRLPTDRVKDPSELETIFLGQPYHPQPLEPVAAPPPARETSAADQPAPASPQASAQLPAVKDDGYAY
jgi:pilus assembly protein CpaC